MATWLHGLFSSQKSFSTFCNNENYKSAIGYPFLDATTHLYKRSCSSARQSVRASVCPVFFLTTNIAIFRINRSQNDITINKTVSDDEVVVFDVLPRYLFVTTSFFTHDRALDLNSLIVHCYVLDIVASSALQICCCH